MQIKRILVPLDLSPASLAGLDYAVDLAGPYAAEIVLLFVVEPLYYAPDFGLMVEEQRRFANEEFARLQPRLVQRGAKFRILIQQGTPYQVITEEAARLAIDLIVMATHGRTGLPHLLLGSVAERVVRTAQCPVLTVRPPLK